MSSLTLHKTCLKVQVLYERSIDIFGGMIWAKVLSMIFQSNATTWLGVAVDEVRHRYILDRGVFLRGETVRHYISCLGATHSALDELKSLSNNLVADPTLPFRRSCNGRFLFDFARREISRLEAQPFILSHDEDFVRFDSSSLREFDEISGDLQNNTAFQALLKLKLMIIQGVVTEPRKNLVESAHQSICTVFNLRTVTNSALLGQPALEGVHSDGVDHTMTTFLGSKNMTSDSAVTFIHDKREVNGTRWDSASSEHLLWKAQHRDFLDTLLIVDNERKHSLSPVYAVDEYEDATRDMLIFFTRKPTNSLHVTYPYDSRDAHKSMPLNLSIPLV